MGMTILELPTEETQVAAPEEIIYEAPPPAPEKFYVDSEGAFMGTWAGSVPATGIEVPIAPVLASQIWNFETQTWSAHDPYFSVPVLSARQLRLGLLQNGIPPSQVENALEAMPAGIERESALIEWYYASTFSRSHPLIASVAVILGLNDAQIDTMWAAALLI
jgi:hypothetical protein